MSQTAITYAFEQWKTQQAVDGKPVILDGFILANVPDLDIALPVDRNEGIPDAAYIVHRQDVSLTGKVNDNAVVYSVTIGADVGDFAFNWVGLVNKATNTLAMIVHAPLQQKVKNAAGQQGNVLTRSFLMEYNGAATETEISTPAETWQIDFTARLAGMDERQRIENVDMYGAGSFFGDGFLLSRNGSDYSIASGVGYVAGLRVVLETSARVTVTTKPVKVWAVASWRGTISSLWGVDTTLKVAAALADYVENGRQHYVFAVASIDANGVITDLRPKGTLNEQAASDALRKHELSRNHPDATLKDKGFVSLYSGLASDSETQAATPKAVKSANDNANGRYSQKGGVLDGNLEAKGDVYAVSGNICARANPDNKSGGAYFFQKVVNGQPVNVGSLMSESDGGHIQISPGNFNSLIRMNGKVVSTQPDNYRIVSNNRGQFWRFDGGNLYLMFTKQDDPHGTWSDARPLIISYNDNSIKVGASVYAGGGASELAADGNVNGRVWGGWLNNYIGARQGDTQNWAYHSFIQDLRFGTSAEFQERSNNERMGGGVMTSFKDAGSSNYWIRIRPLQKFIGGNWYTVGYQ